MSLSQYRIVNFLPFLDAESGAAGGEGAAAAVVPPAAGAEGGTAQPFASFPDAAAFTARMDREANSRLAAMATELGYESVDAMKAASAAAKAKAESDKTDLQKAQDAQQAAEAARTAALSTANTRVVKAEAKVQASALGIKPERIDAALKLADLSAVTVGDDGEPDTAAITTALNAVLTLMPELKGAPADIGGGSNPPGGGNAGKNPWSKEHFNLTEQAKVLRENPTQAQQFIAAAKG